MPRLLLYQLTRLTHRLAVWYDLSVELVHGHEGGGVAVKVDESVGRGLPRELVLDDLDGDDLVLAHEGQGAAEEFLVHVGLKLEEKEGEFNITKEAHSEASVPTWFERWA